MFRLSHFSEFLRVVAFENTLANKDMFKVDDTRATSVNVIWVSFDWLIKYFLKSVTKTVLIKLWVFNINDSGGVCFYLQAMMEPVLVEIEAFAMNGSDGVYDGACFYLHDVVVCF